MYEDLFGFTQRPFALTPDPEFLFWTTQHRRAFNMVSMSLLRHAPIALVTGDIGAGKTTLIRELLRDISNDFEVALLSNVIGDSGDLLSWILSALRQEAAPRSHAEAVCQVEAVVRDIWAQGRRTLVIVDEAQNVSDDGIESLRLLTNLDVGKAAPLSLVLVGQPELRDRLRGVRFVAFRQRLGATCHIGPMIPEETAGYIRRRLEIAGGSPATFSDDAIAAVHRRANGVPRLTNLLCDLCLVAAFAEDRIEIDGAFAEAALAESLEHGGLGGLPAEDVRAEPVGEPGAASADHASPARVREARAEIPLHPSVRSRSARVDPEHQWSMPPQPVDVEPLRLGPELLPTEARGLKTVSDRSAWILQCAVGSAAGLAVAASVAAAALVLPAGRSDSGQPAPPMTALSVSSGSSEMFASPKAVTAPPDPAGAAALYRQALQAASGTDAAVIDYARAAARGHGRAAYYLAQLYETGDGVGFAPSTAAAWYAAAAEKVPAAEDSLQELRGASAKSGDYALPRFSSAESGAFELVWEGRGTFLVELAEGPGAPPAAHVSTRLTAVRLKAPADVTVWRVRESGGAPTGWIPIGGEQKDPAADDLISSR